ncbi:MULTISPECIES: DUF2335 domain-containing protein [Vibrio harveyi group]|uniref:DUF2335 domain-containing protein n=1 Tax=Vibrio harveyi group TaxID=717610 RepID=UPI00168D7A3D|nr:DUF2335 domain-containing protein [Vibrio campbellii]
MSAEKELKPQEDNQVTEEIVEEPTETQLTEVQELLNQLPQEMLVDALMERSEGSGNRSSIQIEQAISQQYSGPLPPPSMLEGYDRVQFGFAERIVSMAEREQEHRHQLENRGVQGAIDKDKRSQRYALGIVIFLASLCGGLIFAGHDIAGSVLGGTTLVGTVALFITGKRDSKSNKDNEDSPTSDSQ